MKLPPIHKRPFCTTLGCKLTKHWMGTWHKDGSPVWRKTCGYCHMKKLVTRRGQTMTQYKNRWHPSRKYRKAYCENRDGRLGFKCHYKIQHECQLQVDHIDGNPSNRDPENYQTLCANCHFYKTWKEQDMLTPGRKTLGLSGWAA
jgi:hypothetical protein